MAELSVGNAIGVVICIGEIFVGKSLVFLSCLDCRFDREGEKNWLLVVNKYQLIPHKPMMNKIVVNIFIHIGLKNFIPLLFAKFAHLSSFVFIDVFLRNCLERVGPRHTQRDESKQAIEKNDDKSLKYQRGKVG
jgi:hypothetical protein